MQVAPKVSSKHCAISALASTRVDVEPFLIIILDASKVGHGASDMICGISDIHMQQATATARALEMTPGNEEPNLMRVLVVNRSTTCGLCAPARVSSHQPCCVT
ncbi:uncharacterized protein PV09_05211 [Verruconis gallopava]|uniref:Uncharacterized protein n=1 Tax=Verruconis gallopava TaxID=253628 RepID=A0A0D1XM04_9PEZI|nr:uncharacterized protein PV09_05211 [Verruconis gallopava]KIW03441.1 hypothetical protein PV09_05211 [Verruconis gallopava]